MEDTRKKYTCDQQMRPGGLIDPLGAENVKRKKVEIFLAGVELPNTLPVNSLFVP